MPDFFLGKNPTKSSEKSGTSRKQSDEKYLISPRYSAPKLERHSSMILPYSYERFHVSTRSSPPNPRQGCLISPALPAPPARPAATRPAATRPAPARSGPLRPAPPPATDFFPQYRIFAGWYRIFPGWYRIFSVLYQIFPVLFRIFPSCRNRIFPSCRNSPIALMQPCRDAQNNVP